MEVRLRTSVSFIAAVVLSWQCLPAIAQTVHSNDAGGAASGAGEGAGGGGIRPKQGAGQGQTQPEPPKGATPQGRVKQGEPPKGGAQQGQTQPEPPKGATPQGRMKQGEPPKGGAQQGQTQPEPPKAAPGQRKQEPPKGKSGQGEPRPGEGGTVEPRPNGANQGGIRQGEPKKGEAAQAHRKPAQLNVQIRPEQRTRITETVKTLGIRPVTNIGVTIAIGTVVPRTVQLRPVPAQIIEIVPEFRRYRFFLAPIGIVIVDPATFEILDVIPV